jgi:hypothetical protein
MAVKNKKTKASGAFNEEDAAILRTMVAGVQSLFEKHAAEIRRVRKESEVDQIKVTFGFDLDFTESAPSIGAGIRYSQTFTDSLVTTLPDPNQPELPIAFTTKEEAKRLAAEAESDGEAAD